MASFCKWLDTFLAEKGVELEERFTVKGASGPNDMAFDDVVHAMKIVSADEQRQLKSLLVRVDFVNGDVRKCLRHLAQAIAL